MKKTKKTKNKKNGEGKKGTKQMKSISNIIGKNLGAFGSQRMFRLDRSNPFSNYQKKEKKMQINFFNKTNSCRQVPSKNRLKKIVDSQKGLKKEKEKSKIKVPLKQIEEVGVSKKKFSMMKYRSSKKQKFFPLENINPSHTSGNFKNPISNQKKNKKKPKKKKKKKIQGSKPEISSKSSRVIGSDLGFKGRPIKQSSILMDQIDSVSSKEVLYDDEVERENAKGQKYRQFYDILEKKVGGDESLEMIRQTIHDIFQDTTSNSWILIFQTSPEFYLLEMEIGKGSFGKVYKAKQILTNTMVALKKICKKTIRMKGVEEKIQREIKILKNLNDHPNVVRLIEEFEDDDFYNLVFEYLPEGDLVSFFRKNDLFCEKKLKKFFYQILEGLRHIHLKGVIHRDIKPENILLNSIISPKIADFGISTIYRKKHPITDTGGTPIYLAPEVIQNKGEICFNTDVWSCGILLYLLAIGDVPFKADEVQILYGKILTDEFDVSSKVESGDVSIELADLLTKMLEKDPRKRNSLEKCMMHPWFSPHNRFFKRPNRRKTQNDRPKSQNCTSNRKLLSKAQLKLLKSDLKKGFKGTRRKVPKGNLSSCRNIGLMSSKKEVLQFVQKSTKNLDRKTIQKQSKTQTKKIENFDTFFNSSTELMNTNSKNYKSQRKIPHFVLSDKEVQTIKVEVVTDFLKNCGFPQKYITDTVFEKDKQFTHIKSCFDQLIESL